MALTDEGNSGIPATMLVGPASFGNAAPVSYPYPVYGGMMGGGSSGGSGNGNGWGDGAWIILLIIVLLAAGGGWGNNQGQGGGFGGGQPIIVNDGGGSSAVQRGFDQAAVMTGIGTAQSGIQALSTQLCNCCCDMQNTVNQGFNAIGTQLCNGFAGVTQGVSNGFAQAEIAANGRQMANMNQAFTAQTAMAQGFNQLGSQFADCCCENRLATERLNYTIATENCADRYEAAQNTRDIIDSQTRGTQAILDKLCNLELDNYRRENDQLRTQLNMANLAASQTAQTAQIRDGQLAATTALVNELRSCPIPAQPVYGNQPIFQCSGPAWNNNNNCGCGCGCGGNGNF